MQQLDRRHFIIAGLALPVAAWSGALSSHAGSMVRASEDPLWFVDPELRSLARGILAESRSLPALTPATLPALRSAPKPWVHAPRPDVPFVKKVIPGKPNAPDLT